MQYQLLDKPDFGVVQVQFDQAGEQLIAESGAMLARDSGIEMKSSIQGGLGGALKRKMLGGESLFQNTFTATAPGQVLVGAFGGIQELQCDGNLVIDTGHLVAWDAGLQYKVGKSGSGWIASYLSGEGLVCHFQGQGRIWIQTRNPVEYGETVGRLLPPREN